MHARLMSVCIRLTAIIILQLLNKQVYSQSPVYKNYTVNDGLPSQVVYCALQDKLGYMWFGTDAGVSRFDGRVFQNFTMKNGLTDNEILNMFQDSEGRIWFYTLNGKICYYFKGNFINSLEDSSLTHVTTKYEFMSFHEDSTGNIWLGGFGSQMILVRKNKQISVFNLQHPEIGFRRSWVYPYEFSRNEMWFYTPNSVYRFRDGQMSLKDTLNSLHPFQTKFHLFKHDSNRYYFYSIEGIFCLEDGITRKLIDSRSIPGFEDVVGTFVDNNMNIYLLTKQNRTLQFINSEKGYQTFKILFEGPEIGQICLDREGNKWFCSTTNGIFFERPVNYNTNSARIEYYHGTKSTTNISLDKEGRLWFGSNAGELNCLDMGKIIVYEYPGLSKIKGIKFDSKQNLWFVTTTGIRKLPIDKIGDRSFIPILIPLEYWQNKYSLVYGAKKIEIDHRDSIVVSVTSGLTKLKNRNGKEILTYWSLGPPSSKRIYCLHFDYLNRLWFENFNTLYCVMGEDNIKLVEQASNLFSSQISDINELIDSTLVISTYGNGVHFFRNGRIINQISAKNGLAGDLCRKLFIDSNTVYVATNQGFSFFRYINNSISDIRTITTSDGIVSNDIKDICVRGENIYLATSGGLCIVKKDIVQTTADPPPLYFISVSSRGTEIQELANLKFPYKADFSLNYIAITFDQPDKVTYQYNVTGEESDWIETRNSSIAFSSLSPGDYTFRLRAKKFNSDWSNMASLQFTIVPPLWQQWWFSLLIFLCLAAATYFLLRSMAESRFKTQLGILKEKQMLADERSRIAADMHDDLGADLSNLLLMNRMAGKERPERMTIDSQSSRFEAHIHEIILKVDEIIWALNPRNDTLNGTIEFMRNYVVKISQLIGVKSVVEMPQSLPVVPVSANFRRNLFLVLKEALNNIYHHSEANMLNLTFKIMANDLHLLIGDNGKGFDVKPGQPGADGLINMQKRIQELGGKFSISSRIGAGSEIKIIVPFC